MSLKDFGRNMLFQMKKHGPEIATGFGVTCGAAAVVVAFIKADDVKRKIKEHKERMEELHNDIEEMGDELNDTERRQLVVAEYVKTGWEVTKSSWLFVLLELLSIGLVAGGTTKLVKRCNNATSMLAALMSLFTVYRERVADKIGIEEEERLYLGEKVEEIEVTEIDENGLEKVIKRKEKSYDPAALFSIIFEEETCPKVFDGYRNNQLRYDFLIGVQRQVATSANVREVYLDEVFDLIGYEGYKKNKELLDSVRRAGWRKGDVVDFGIKDCSQNVTDFLDNKDAFMMLVFNCRPDIYGDVSAAEGLRESFRNRELLQVASLD